MNQEELARAIYEIIGPRENILQVSNCMTRLRVYLKEQPPGLTEQLQQLEGVAGIHDNHGELQVILGPGRAQNVTTMLKEIMEKAPVSRLELARQAEVGDGEQLHQAIRRKNDTPLNKLFKKIAAIFVPLIPAFIACGLITGVLNICLKAVPELAGGAIVSILAVMGSAIYYGLNLFVGVNAAKVFGGTPIIGGVLAAVITNPALGKVVLFGETLVPGRGGIIAVVLVAALAAWLEKKLHRLVPEMLDLFLTPLLVLLVSGFAAIFLLQPLGGVLAENIGLAATAAVREGGALTGFIMGGCWLPIVMLGIHQAMTPIHAELLAQYGVTILLPMLAMAGCGQIGASFAVYFKTKNKFLKKTVLSALPVGIMGVGEPLIYGVTLPLGRPFIGACIGGAFGGAIEAAAMVGARAMGLSGLPLTAVTDNMPVYLLGLVTAYGVGFLATWLLGFDDPEETGRNS